MLRAMLLSRPKPPQAGAEGQPLQEHSSKQNCPPRSVGRPLPLPQPLAVEPNRPPRRAKFTHSKFKRARKVFGSQNRDLRRLLLYGQSRQTEVHPSQTIGGHFLTTVCLCRR